LSGSALNLKAQVMAHDGSMIPGGARAALAARYGLDNVPAVGPWNDTIAALLTHRSVRGYKPDAVPARTFETLVAAAQSAATSSNLQTWSVIAVRDPARKALFAKLSNNQKHIEQCPLFLVFLADVSRMERLQQADGVTLETLPFQETFLVAAVDAALAAQNAVIAAESLGLSTVYIGAMRNHPLEVAKELKLPNGCFAVFGLCVGYASDAGKAEVKPRLPQHAIAFDEQYAVPDEAKIRAAYDAEMAAFSARNEMAGASTWTQRVTARMGKIAAMGGRDKLAAKLQALGFPLR
jgi:nitroreductase